MAVYYLRASTGSREGGQSAVAKFNYTGTHGERVCRCCILGNLEIGPGRLLEVMRGDETAESFAARFRTLHAQWRKTKSRCFGSGLSDQNTRSNRSLVVLAPSVHNSAPRYMPTSSRRAWIGDVHHTTLPDRVTMR